MGPDYFQQDDIYGLQFLAHISSEIQSNKLPKLLIPVVILSGFDHIVTSPGGTNSAGGSYVLADSMRLTRYLDAGAVDVLTSPISKDNVQGLAVHAYRVFKEVTREETAFIANKHNRKLSWVGVEDSKPYAYLREAMVSSLMNGICNPEMTGETYDPRYGRQRSRREDGKLRANKTPETLRLRKTAALSLQLQSDPGRFRPTTSPMMNC